MKIGNFDYPMDYLARAGIVTGGSALALTMCRWESVRIIGLLVLAAGAYGIINDLIGCTKCVEYFTKGHTPFHKRLIPSDHPIPNAILWGVHATWCPALLAGGIIAVVARIGQSKLYPINTKQLAVVLAIGIGVLLVIAHTFSMLTEYCYKKTPNEVNKYFNQRTIHASPGCQNVYLDQIPPHKRAAWLANSDRNLAGYLGLLVGGSLLIIGMIAFRILKRS